MTRESIRAARTEDVEAIVGLNAALFAEDAGTRDPFTNVDWPAEEGSGHFLRLVRDDEAVCLLAVVEGEILGYLAGYVREPSSLRPVSVAELESMYVRGNLRSGGLGGRLVDQFCSWARKRGADRLSVTAYAANGRAIRFYEGRGFRSRSVSLEVGL